MLIAMGIVCLIHQSSCVDTNSVLFNEVFTYHNETAAKAEFAYQVVSTIYGSFRQWFFTITFCEFTYFENRILKYTENTDYGYPVVLLNGCPDKNTTKVKPRIDKHGQTAYIITSDELTLDDSEFATDALIRTGVFKPRSAVIFVINQRVQVDSYFNYAMESHFQLLWSRRITNSVLILWVDKLRMYTYNPFLSEVREITDVKDVSGLLAKQYEDLYGHKLRLSVFKKIFIYDKDAPIVCDSRLASTVMSHMNATCVPLAPRDGNTVGDLLDNGTATGVTADLMDGYTDLELNSRILKNSYYGYIDTSYPLSQDELCFLVKKSGKQSTFTTTLQLMSTQILIFFLFNFVFFILLALLIRRIETKLLNLKEKYSTGTVFVDLVKCFVRQTVDITFLGPIFRFVVLMIMIYSLVIDCAIDGIIISAIAYPRYKPDMNTMSELAATNLTLGVHNRHMKLFNKSLTPEYYELLKNRIEVFSDDKIKNAIDKRQFDYAILLRKTDALYITRKQENMQNGRPIFHTMKECPVPCSIVYGLRYGSPYLIRLNDILHHLHQGGILQHWTQTEEYSWHHDLYSEDNKEKKALSTEHLLEVFIVFLIGILVSAIVFFFEVVNGMSKFNVQNTSVSLKEVKTK